MKKTILSLLVALMATTGARAQSPTTSGTWTLAATPAFDVELEVEYETALALSETTDNSAAPTMPPTHWTAAASARPHRRVCIFRMVKR